MRQCTNWASRFGIARYAQDTIVKVRHGDKGIADGVDKAMASILAGALSCWNQPLEVIRVEMQSQLKAEGRPEKMTIGSATKYIYNNNGLKGFYRGLAPRIGLGIWQTLVMVGLGTQNYVCNMAFHSNYSVFVGDYFRARL